MPLSAGALAVVVRLELRINGDAQLPSDERHQDHYQDSRAETLVGVHCLPQPPRRRHAHESDRDEQIQPQPGRRIDFVVTEHERQQRDAAGGGSE
jgi:hypothetical protein